MKNDSDEDLYFSKKERNIYEMEIENKELRENLFENKEIGYTKGMNLKEKYKNIICVLFGYLHSTYTCKTSVIECLADLIYENENLDFLENRVSYILKNRISDLKEIINLLKNI
ncbi:hypothetical protein CWI39_0062p0020 [Hamiltosporidium magnivora]|uniref:Uncharacterized protein n=1 Tax=Hamiltosporidium magnivora TaxID=148818 RepID=A0A4Q9LQA0_9MICR|nr:hypothetical protein CWI39_0062p0020 [Hamiltosporidium magnivora]